MNRMNVYVSVVIALIVFTGCRGDIDEVTYRGSVYIADDDGELYSASPRAVVGVDASRNGVIDFDDPHDMEHRYEPDPGFGAHFESTFYLGDEVDPDHLARIKTKPTGPVHETTTGVLDIDEASRGRVRLYVNTGGGDRPDSFEPYEPGTDRVGRFVVHTGAEFAIEALPPGDGDDSDEDWDGVVELRWEIEVGEIDHSTYDKAQIELSPLVLLGVDASRSGEIDFGDPLDIEHRWEPAQGFGALFLANLDDDANNCAGLSTDADFEQCYDARRDEIVNDADLQNMARIKTAPTGHVAQDMVGVLDVDEASRGRVRLFINDGVDAGPDAFVPYEAGDQQISSERLREGVEFAIEGLSLVDDHKQWDGQVELSWQLQREDLETDDDIDQWRDRARIELAPVLFRHHMDGARTVYAADLGSRNAEFIADLDAATDAAGVENGLELLDIWDPWVQDYLLTGYMAIPGPDGVRSIQMYFRSANLNYLESIKPIFEQYYASYGESMPPLLREAGRLVFTDFHGSGIAGRAKYDPDMGFEPVDMDGVDVDDAVNYLSGSGSHETYPEIAALLDAYYESDTLNSFGNTEVVPPHVAPDGEAYPHGRVFRGDGPDPMVRPDPTLSHMIDGQGAQPLIWLDTNWLLVKHVDEIITFVETDTERGWSMLYNDPVRARDILEQLQAEGHGDELLFEDRYYPGGWGGGGGSPAERTVDQVLDDDNVMAASARAAVEVDAQVDILQQEVGIGDDEMIPIAFLHEDSGGGILAYQPGIINGISLQPDVFGAPKPQGPWIDGEDVFQADVESLLNPVGVGLHWIESWDVYHVGVGQVHCGSNVERELPTTPWWAKESE